MKIEPKSCTCTITLPTSEYNKMVEYIKKLEDAVGKSCGNCVGCEYDDGTYTRRSLSKDRVKCDSWIWNEGSE